MMHRLSQRAFTLIELAIVLVCIGLLAGGIMVGASMIHSSEIQSLIAEKDRHIKNTTLFLQKYNGLPGDLADATRHFGEAASCRVSAAIPDVDPGVCNGNGDDSINPPTANTESLMAWQHLTAAGLMEGRFTGVASTAPMQYEPGVNVPLSSIQGHGFQLFQFGEVTASAQYFNGPYGHVLYFAGRRAGEHVLFVEDAFIIDKKIDDGKPGRGIVRAAKNTLFMPACATTPVSGSAETNAVYDVGSTGRRCSLFFITGF